MYDINKRKPMIDVTVGDLITLLRGLPTDAKILCCGDNVAHIHVEKDNSVVNIDTENLDECYDEEVKMNMTVADLKAILNSLSDDLPVVIPVIDERNANQIFGFRHVRTAGILHDEYEPTEPRVLCINSAEYGVDISTQMQNKPIVCEKVLF